MRKITSILLRMRKITSIIIRRLMRRMKRERRGATTKMIIRRKMGKITSCYQ